MLYPIPIETLRCKARGMSWALLWIGFWAGSGLLWVTAQESTAQEAAVQETNAEEKPAAADAATIRRWVEQLGDSQFEVRDQASARLSRLSPDQLDFLKEMLAGASDPEVIVRLSSVVAKLKAQRQREIVGVFLRDTDLRNDHGLGGWSSFSKVAGLSRSSKRLFLQLYDRFPELVEESLDDPKAATELGMRLVKSIQIDEMRLSDADKTDGLALLYCTCVATGNEQSNLAPMALRVLLRAPYNQALRDPQSKRAIESMVELWSQSMISSYEQVTALQIMLEANLSTSKSLAKRMLESYKSGSTQELEPRDALRAFQVFFRFGKPEDLPLLEKWLENEDVCEELVSLNFPGGPVPLPGRAIPPDGQPNAQRPMATVELRDAALLACMQIAGMDHRSYFKNLLQSPLWGYVPKSIALPAGSEAIRQERLEAWKRNRP